MIEKRFKLLAWTMIILSVFMFYRTLKHNRAVTSLLDNSRDRISGYSLKSRALHHNLEEKFKPGS